jgi:pimeloyl-ACP methyl ester carboxylesterase
MVNSELPKDVTIRQAPRQSRVNGITFVAGVIGRRGETDAIPVVGAAGPEPIGRPVVIWLHPKGKASLLEDGKVGATLRSLDKAGCFVSAPDLLGVGENAFPKPIPVDNKFAGYTYGYNRSLVANRVHDVLTCIGYWSDPKLKKTIHLVGWGEMGIVAILARALAGDAVKKTAADLNGFNFENIKDANDPMTLPGALKYGGMGAFLGLCTPGEVLVHNHKHTGSGDLSRAAYEAAGAADKLTRSADKLDDAKVVEWLVK